MAKRVLILGAAGRDFHEFNMAYRDDPSYEVIGFTATQIPNISERRYPPELAGDLYPAGIPIFPESELESIIRDRRVDEVVFAYSDVSHIYVMHLAARARAAGASFVLPGDVSRLTSRLPVVAVTAVRTGAGKSPLARRIRDLLVEAGRRVGVMRHPMAYGDLSRQRMQRFSSYEDLDLHSCTIEEREEYEHHIAAGAVVFAGVDYVEILQAAESESDLILWDGGNNDLPFLMTTIHFCVVDPHRPGHEVRYWPGEANLRAADIVVVNKVGTARPEDIDTVLANVGDANPEALIIKTESPIQVADPDLIAGKRVLVVEDGPTVTHGDMEYGAGVLAAKEYGATELIDPRPYAVGTVADAFAEYPHIGPLLPAVGYDREQIAELAETITRAEPDSVLVGTPIDLSRLLDIDVPTTRATYGIKVVDGPSWEEILAPVL
ncbi:MAG: cyclic 2,3-diphosphoglycerate synthase [Acidimicrobiia bacterium]